MRLLSIQVPRIGKNHAVGIQGQEGNLLWRVSGIGFRGHERSGLESK